MDAASGLCLHCLAPLEGPEARAHGFCCRGCERVHALLSREGLDRYYELRRGAGLPVGELAGPSLELEAWMQAQEARLAASAGPAPVALDLQGVHCAGCVWLIDTVARREGALRCDVSATRGRLELVAAPSFDLRAFVRALASLGYRAGPPLKRARAGLDGLTVRVGVTAALAANAMMLSLAIYLGLEDGPLHATVRDVAFALGAAAVLVGGGPLVRAAIEALRRGVLSLDLPIALGLLLASIASVASWVRGGDAGFADSLAVFVALVLGGRWLQERMVAIDRDRLLATDGAEGLVTRRVTDGGVEMVRCMEVRRGDRLLLAAGDLVPVEAVLEDPCLLSMDWIDGESQPRDAAAGTVAPAGSFVAGARAARAVVAKDFVESSLHDLLRTPPDRRRGDLLDRLVGPAYVLIVLALAGGGAALWLALEGPGAALSVATAVLVVTCPCALGLALPLAHERTLGMLRRAGVYVREPSALARAAGVDRVVFDKTGTLTFGAPRLADAGPLEALSEAERAIAYRLAAQSSHPKAAAVSSALPAVSLEGAPVHEQPGAGVQVRIDGALYRLGKPSWAAPGRDHGAADLVFAKDGAPLARLETVERPRPGAEDEIAKLAEAGYPSFILSGDAPSRVQALAARVGVPEERAFGGASPREKADWLAARDPERALFLGDGLNDGPAADVAGVSGTPAVDRPFMPARTDFYFVTAGLGAVRALLGAAARLRRTTRGILALAVVYNAVAVTLALAGRVEPWTAAALMPAGSLATLAYTRLSLKEAA
ncbi:MAG: heavy metal translocating P-type ATPase metal-binding domain-containing protein [Myxococcota bacterium]|nr:heavy metal translocating P-type ATPase metal-binding domain-containing protein [Myxococcota bacterium]